MLETFRKVCVLSVAAILVGTGEAAAQRESGIQRTPDGARVLVSKDVGGQRYAITLNVADGTATGNVFSADGSAPQFISCTPTGLNAFSCRVAATCDPSAARESGIQRAFDSQAVLVSKDVGGERYAITQNVDGTLTGNVFLSATGDAKFLFCTPDEVGGYSCAVADSCTTLPCVDDYLTLDSTITLPDTFFTLPGSCVTYGDPIAITLPKYFFVPDAELLGEASRLAIVSNPFRTQTGRGGPINDFILGARNIMGPAQVGDVAVCPSGGIQRLDKCEQQGTTSFSSITFVGCRSGDNTSAVEQNGTIEISRPDSLLCQLLTPGELPIGIEVVEQRRDFETKFEGNAGQLLERDTENDSMFTTVTAPLCVDQSQRLVSVSRRGISGVREAVIRINDTTGETANLSQAFDFVGLSRDFDLCGPLNTTLSSGDDRGIATIDGTNGESYATNFPNLTYVLPSGEKGATSLTIDGSLQNVCGGPDPASRRTFAYRTLTPASFDRNGDGCPRGGAFEVSTEGIVLGQMAFTDTGGVTLTLVGSEPTTVPSCNDAALLRTSCRALVD